MFVLLHRASLCWDVRAQIPRALRGLQGEALQRASWLLDKQLEISCACYQSEDQFLGIYDLDVGALFSIVCFLHCYTSYSNKHHWPFSQRLPLAQGLAGSGGIYRHGCSSPLERNTWFGPAASKRFQTRTGSRARDLPEMC